MKYTNASGEEILEFRKGWTEDKLEIIMKDVSTQDGLSIDDMVDAPEEDVIDPETGEILEEAPANE